MALTLLQLSYFLAAVRHGTLSAAADALDISQPSLSEQIAKLERHLGTPLFVRGRKGLTLTPAGSTLRPYAEQILSSVSEARDAVNDVRTLASGSVELGTFSSAHHYLLADVVAEFRSTYPNVTVRVVGNNSTEVADAVRSGDLEAGLVAIPIDDRGLEVSATLWTCEVVYLHVDPAKVAKSVTIQQIAATPLVLPEARWGDADPTRRRLALLAQQSGVVLRPQAEVESPAAALEVAALGVGGTVAALPLARVLGYTDRMHWAPLRPPLRETFAFITRRDAHISPATHQLMRITGKHLRRMHRQQPSP